MYAEDTLCRGNGALTHGPSSSSSSSMVSLYRDDVDYVLLVAH
jgi:hypothetical protein